MEGGWGGETNERGVGESGYEEKDISFLYICLRSRSETVNNQCMDLKGIQLHSLINLFIHNFFYFFIHLFTSSFKFWLISLLDLQFFINFEFIQWLFYLYTVFIHLFIYFFILSLIEWFINLSFISLLIHHSTCNFFWHFVSLKKFQSFLLF